MTQRPVPPIKHPSPPTLCRQITSNPGSAIVQSPGRDDSARTSSQVALAQACIVTPGLSRVSCRCRICRSHQSCTCCRHPLPSNCTLRVTLQCQWSARRTCARVLDARRIPYRVHVRTHCTADAFLHHFYCTAAMIFKKTKKIFEDF